jgi:capsular exopolysaccharide synthesis family protein
MKKEEMGMLDYLRRLRSRGGLMASVFIAVLATVAAATFMMKPVYKATAEVYIDPDAGSQFGHAQVQRMQDNSLYVQTQLSIFQSEAIARKVVGELGLDKVRGAENKSKPFLSGMNWPWFPATAVETDEEKIERAVKKFKRKLSADYIPSSNVITVSYEAGNPEFAANVVNKTVDSVIQQNLDLKMAPAKDSMAWLEGRLGSLKDSMNQSAGRLQSYKAEKGLIVTGDRQANISLQGLADLNSKVLAASANRYAAEVRYHQVQKLAKDPAMLLSYPDMIENKTIQSLKVEQNTLAKEVADGSKKYGDRHPQMVRLHNEMDAVNRQMEREAALVVAAVKTGYEGALRTEQALKDALDTQKAEAMSYERRSAEYTQKEQDVEGARQTYDEILRKFQESNILGSIGVSSVQFLHRAAPPLKPDKPQKVMYLALGTLFALMCSISFGVTAEYLDDTCRSADDIEDGLGLSVLGVVPRNTLLTGARGKDGPLALPQPSSLFAESFRNIKGNILLRTDDNPRVIQVGSAVSAEGKSVVALNLACSLALAGDRVIVIDADMRQPSLHRYLKLPKGPGLTGLLGGRSGLAEAVIKTDIPNLEFIPAGQPTAGSGEMIKSEAMRELLGKLRSSYDRVIIDCPPFLGPVDSYLLTPLVDGVVLVVLSGKTGREMLVRMMKDLRAINARMLGCVLNDAVNRTEQYYSYSYETRARQA